MELKYIGPKAVISEHGISFKDGKEDKYVYINNAVDIFNAINHEYKKNRVYNHNIEPTLYSSSDIINNLQNKLEGFEEAINLDIVHYKKSLDEQESDIDTKPYLAKEDKMAFKNNLNIMREYRTQRFINKSVYEHVVKAISDTIVKNQIKELRTPFNERFWHILQTIAGWLSHDYKIDTTLDTVTDDENITIKLHINKIY